MQRVAVNFRRLALESGRCSSLEGAPQQAPFIQRPPERNPISAPSPAWEPRRRRA